VEGVDGKVMERKKINKMRKRMELCVASNRSEAYGLS
jgi:hypothetical protein